MLGYKGGRSTDRRTVGRAARLGSARIGSARLGSARLGSARLGSARISSARLGSARLGSAWLGPARLGPAGLGSAWKPKTRSQRPPRRGPGGHRMPDYYTNLENTLFNNFFPTKSGFQKTQDSAIDLARQDEAQEAPKCQITVRFLQKSCLTTFSAKNEKFKIHKVTPIIWPAKRRPMRRPSGRLLYDSCKSIFV